MEKAGTRAVATVSPLDLGWLRLRACRPVIFFLEALAEAEMLTNVVGMH
jgi:hypothetical protein